CGDEDGVDVFLLLEHPPVVFPTPGLGEFPKRPRGVSPIHIAQRDDILILKLVEVGAALPGHADPGEVQLLAGRRLAPQPEDRARDEVERSHSESGAMDEVAPRAATKGRLDLHSEPTFDAGEPRLFYEVAASLPAGRHMLSAASGNTLTLSPEWVREQDRGA